MRSLTGIAAVDAVELIALGALLVYVASRRDATVRAVTTVSFVAFAKDIGTSAPASLVTGVAIALIVRIIFTDRIARRIGAYALGASAAAFALVGLLALSVRGDANDVRAHLRTLRTDLTADDPATATRNLADSDARLGRIQARITGPLTQPARVVPFAGKQLAAGRDLVATVRAIVRTARASITGIHPHDLKLQHGRVPVERLTALRQPALAIQTTTRTAARRARVVRRQFLWPPLNHLADELVRETDSTQRSAALIASLAAEAPGLFGDHGDRRYFLLFQNPAEARASGGILGAYAELSANHGQLKLAAVGRDKTLNDLAGDSPRSDVPGFARFRRLQPTRYWQNMTTSPDFPTVAAEIEREYAPIVHPVDGVISIDPTAVAAMLRVVGPVTVPNWPVPLTADNAVAVFEHDQYVRFAAAADYPKREAFMAAAIAAIWSHVTSAENFSLNDGLAALGRAVDGGHIAMQAVRSGEQSLFRRAGMSGAFPHDLPTDVLAVTSHNTGANKLDWFSTRTVTYAPRIDRHGELTATLTIRLCNNVPPGEPGYVAGENDPTVAREHDPQLVSIYSPLSLDDISLNGTKTTADVDREFDMNVYAIQVDQPPGVQQTIVLHLRGRWRYGEDYELAYRPQALVHGDELRLVHAGRRVSRAVTRRRYQSSSIRFYRFPT